MNQFTDIVTWNYVCMFTFLVFGNYYAWILICLFVFWLPNKFYFAETAAIVLELEWAMTKFKTAGKG